MSNEEFILSIVTELNLNSNVKQISNEEFILLIVTELNLNLNVKRICNEEFIFFYSNRAKSEFECQTNF